MPDREKVIKGLHDARRYLEDKEWSDRGASPHIDAINDALAMLKEQEHKDKMFHALEADWKRLKALLKEQELVRCKDCVFGKREKNDSTGMTWIYCGHHRENRPEDWFCASGSRT